RTECAALGEAPAEARAILAAAPIAGEPDFLLHKTTERSAYRPFDPPAGIFDTLLWNARGELTEFTRGNLIVEIDGARLTPPLSCGLLPGTLRAELIERGEIAEGVVRVAELARVRALWFINSVRGRIPVRLATDSQAVIPE
ncbi:MAG: aminotransferase class IV, partial [Sulfuritalea sp.]|nr:aminotransferase class IV [Sulfuritalea sp.]